jgi:hypothetical protein
MPMAIGLRSRQIADGDLETLAKFLGRGLGYPKRFPRGISPRLVRGQYSSGSRFE